MSATRVVRRATTWGQLEVGESVEAYVAHGPIVAEVPGFASLRTWRFEDGFERGHRPDLEVRASRDATPEEEAAWRAEWGSDSSRLGDLVGEMAESARRALELIEGSE